MGYFGYKFLSATLTLATLLALAPSPGGCIRVTFGTKEGPIEPPEPPRKIVPKPPFKTPAPVWEDQSDDLPNPHPFRYNLPHPSSEPPSYHFYKPFYPKYSHYPKKVQQFGLKFSPGYGYKYYPIAPQRYVDIKDNDIDSNTVYDDTKYNSEFERKYNKYSQGKLYTNIFPLVSRKSLIYFNQPYYSSKIYRQ